MVKNYLLAALGGSFWCFQFFYTMSESRMDDYEFSSWTIHMASIIIFSTLWGLALMEWKDANRKSKVLLLAEISLLVLSTILIGVGNSLQ